MASLAAKTVNIGGVRVGALSQEEWAALLIEDCRVNRNRSARPKFMTSANGYVLSLQATDPKFRRLLDEADGIDADGMPLVLASRWLGSRPLPERVATTDFFHVAARRAEEAGVSFFLLGGTEEENLAAVERVQAMYPRLRIAGRRNGYFSRADEPALAAEITGTRTDMLWVGMGVPNEHEYIVRNRDQLVGVTWIKSCGGLFKFLSGKDKRAPRWMQDWSLEWMYRLVHEPRRLIGRYSRTNCHAIYLMYKYRRLTRDSHRNAMMAGGSAPRAS